MSDDRRKKPIEDEATLPNETLPAHGSRMFSGKAGMMRLPETIEQGRRAPGPHAQDPRSARSEYRPAEGSRPRKERALARGQVISLTDTAISAMPSQSRDLVVLHERDGAFASELRILATRLQELQSRLGHRAFLVTSVGEGEGKTVLSSNLALVMSEDTERKVALIDANFRSPRAAELFNLDKQRGLRSVLEGKLQLAQCVAKVIARNLVVMPAGGSHPNPAAMLSSPRFKSLLAELIESVDFLIIDAPAAIPYADVPLLTQHVDGIIMLGCAVLTKRGGLDRALDAVGRKRVIGSVFMDRSKSLKTPA